MMAVTGFLYYKKFTIVVDVDGERVTAYEEVRKGPTYLMDAQEIVEGGQQVTEGARLAALVHERTDGAPAKTLLTLRLRCDCVENWHPDDHVIVRTTEQTD
jgi:hypothetical protein